jgi:ribonuclease HI
MSTFLLPTTLGEEIQRMINSFWWGTNGRQGKGINWLSWDKLTMRKEFGGMNFRHFYGFNLAMLGKQGWKLLTDQDTIVTKIFKARYFPQSDFLGARLGHNPSFVWRSIYTSQVIVKGGLRWCIGDGKDISVWNEPWLRTSENSYIMSPLLQGGENLKVADLMDEATCTWKWDLINAIFNDRDIREIKKMAAINGGEADHKVWKFNNKGSYTVKSAYRYSMETLVDNEEYRVPGEWMHIWNLKIPQRVKIFMWRVLRGCLPTRDKLQRKGVQCTDLCPHCETTYENEWHLFIGCEKAKRVWIAAGLWDDISQVVVAANSFNSLVFSFLTVHLEKKCSDFVLIMWCLWKRRNEKIWEEAEKPVHVSINAAREYLLQWREIKAKQEKAYPATVNNRVRWQPPTDGEFKCNVDAALFNEEQQFGMGMCIRGAHGTYVKARTMVFEGTPPPLEAEAYALKEALIWLEELGISRVVIELDCMLVVNAINEKLRDSTEFGAIIKQCRLLLDNHPNFKISFIRRQANFVAHTLARASKSYASRQTFELIPSCIVPILMNEVI